MCRHGPSPTLIDSAQFAQRVGPEAGKHQEPVGCRQPVPLRDQRLRVGCHVQRHVGPQQIHTFVRHDIETFTWPLPSAQGPPGCGEDFTCPLHQGDGGFDDKCFGCPVSAGHQCMRFKAAAQRRPVQPAARLRLDPLQPIGHAASDFFVQPGRPGIGRRREPGPPQGSWWIDGGRTLGNFRRHEGQYIEPAMPSL